MKETILVKVTKVIAGKENLDLGLKGILHLALFHVLRQGGIVHGALLKDSFTS